MASIAVEHGFFWETLWNLPENAKLKETRQDPYVLLPGDPVFIPALRMKEQARPTDQRHKFKVKGVPERVRIVITDEDDRPLANQPYTLEIDKQEFAGQTDGSGAIQHAIPPNARKGRLVVGEGEDKREFFVGLGHVDPVEEISGVHARLFNLGYYHGPLNGPLTAQTTTALLLFQDKYQLSATGENDAATQAKLKELFGC